MTPVTCLIFPRFSPVVVPSCPSADRHIFVLTLIDWLTQSRTQSPQALWQAVGARRDLSPGEQPLAKELEDPGYEIVTVQIEFLNVTCALCYLTAGRWNDEWSRLTLSQQSQRKCRLSNFLLRLPWRYRLDKFWTPLPLPTSVCNQSRTHSPQALWSAVGRQETDSGKLEFFFTAGFLRTRPDGSKSWVIMVVIVAMWMWRVQMNVVLLALTAGTNDGSENYLFSVC